MDPGFKYGMALSEVAGHTVLRFSNADIFPFRFSNTAKQFTAYVNQIEREINLMRRNRKYQKRLYVNNAYVLASDPTKNYNPPELKSSVPYINFAPLENAVAHLSGTATVYDSVLMSQMQNNITLSAQKLLELNEQLQSVSQALLSKQGLPKRPWYRNMITAPDYYTGYGASTLPGVRGAIEQRQWSIAGTGIIQTARVINHYASRIDKIIKSIE